MPVYTMRRTSDAEGGPDDFVSIIEGKDAGRCYRMRASGNRDVWAVDHLRVRRRGDGDSLEEAQRKLKAATAGR